MTEKENIVVGTHDDTEACAETVLVRSLGAQFVTREDQMAYSRAVGSDDARVAIITFSTLSIPAGGHAYLDTRMIFDIKNVEAEVSMHGFLNNIDVFKHPVERVVKQAERINTGVRILVRNVGNRPVSFKPNETIGWLSIGDDKPETVIGLAQ